MKCFICGDRDIVYKADGSELLCLLCLKEVVAHYEDYYGAIEFRKLLNLLQEIRK